MAEANVCQRVHAVFVKNKAYLRGVIKEGLSSFLDNQKFLTETEKLAAQDVLSDENKRLGDLMELIKNRISEDSDFFATVLSCLKDSGYNLDNIKKEIEEARETALSAHSSISESTESYLDQSNASFDGNVIPQPITRRQSTGDIPFRDLPTTSQISPSHQKGVRKRPSSASEKYLSPYASSGSSKKVSTPSRPGSGQRKQGGTPNVSPVHRPQSSGSSVSPLESPMSPMSPMSLSGSFIMDTINEIPAVQGESSLAGDDSVFFEDSEVDCQQPVEQQMSQNEEEHTRHGITAEDKEALLLNKLEKVNDSVEKTRTELVIGSHVTCSPNVYKNARQECHSLIEYYQHEIHQLREEMTRVQREQSREINVQRSNVQAEREAKEDLQRLIKEKKEILEAQNEEVKELRQEFHKLNEEHEQSDAEKEALKCRLAKLEYKLYEQDQSSCRKTKQIRRAMLEYGIPKYSKAQRLEEMKEKWEEWKKVGEKIESLCSGEDPNVSHNFIQKAVFNTRHKKRPSTSLY